MKKLLLISVLLLIVGCSVIDDDLSLCGQDYKLRYTMRLVTNIHLRVEEKLSAEEDRQLADTLKKWLSPIFDTYAHDLDMSFFSQDGQDKLCKHSHEIINAMQKSYTLYLPVADYMHLAVVNTDNNDYVHVEGAEHAATFKLSQHAADTIMSHPTAVFAARLPMEMKDGVDQEFEVNMYMTTSAVALVIVSAPDTMPEMDVLLSGTATGFMVRDSVFLYDNSTLIRAEKVTDRCYAMLSWPSRDNEANAVQARSKQANTLWEVRSYAHMTDGSITETILSVDTALEAGTLEILKVEMLNDGSLKPVENAHVGASVTLDWKEGNHHDVVI